MVDCATAERNEPAGQAAVVGAGYAVLQYYNGSDQKISAMRSAQAKVAELGPRIEVIKSTKGPEFRPIKLLGDVRSAMTGMSRITNTYAPATGDIASLHDARYLAFTKLQSVAREIR